MEKPKSKIPLYIGAISSIFLLSAFLLLVNPNNVANALQTFELTPPSAPSMVRQTSFNGVYYLVDFGTKSGQPFADVYNENTGVFIASYNLTVGTGFTSGNTLMGANCGATHAICAVAYAVSTHNDRVFLLDIFHGWIQTTAGGTPYSANFVRNLVYVESSIQDQVFVIKNDGVSIKIDNWVVPTTSGQTAFTTTPFIFGYTYNTAFSATIAVNDFEYGLFNTTNSASSISQYLGWTSATNNLIVIIDIGARATKCQTSIGGDTATLDIQYMNDTGNGVNNVNGLDWIVAGSTATDTFVKIDNSCNLKTSYNMAGIIQTNYPIRSLGFSQARHEIYAYAGTAKNSLVVINATKTGTPATSAFVTGIYQMSEDKGSPFYNGIVAQTTSNGMVAIGETSKIYWLYWQTSGLSGNSPSGTAVQSTYLNSAGQTCVDVYIGTTNNFITYCSSSNNPNHINTGNAGALGAVRSGQNITQTTAQYVCATGLIDKACTNGDSKTNGVGYILLLATVIFSVIMVYGSIGYIASRTGKDVSSTMLAVPKELIIVMLLIDLGIAYFGGWTDGIPFYLFIIVMIGLSGLGITSYILSRKNGGG